MEPRNLISHGLVGKTVDLLSRALDYRAKNHDVIAGNLANIDTPTYKPKELLFDEELRQAAEREQVRLRTTHEKHLRGPVTGILGEEAPFPLQEQKPGKTGSREVDLDREMAKMTENNLLYQATVRILSRKFEALKTAITEGRR